MPFMGKAYLLSRSHPAGSPLPDGISSALCLPRRSIAQVLVMPTKTLGLDLIDNALKTSAAWERSGFA
jgi:hypothetical protein